MTGESCKGLEALGSHVPLSHTTKVSRNGWLVSYYKKEKFCWVSTSETSPYESKHGSWTWKAKCLIILMSVFKRLQANTLIQQEKSTVFLFIILFQLFLLQLFSLNSVLGHVYLTEPPATRWRHVHGPGLVLPFRVRVTGNRAVE